MTQASGNTVTTDAATVDTVTLQQLIDNSDDMIKQSLITLAQAADNLDAIQAIPFYQLKLDSRQVGQDDVFILLSSQTQNPEASLKYLEQAAAQAAFIYLRLSLTLC